MRATPLAKCHAACRYCPCPEDDSWKEGEITAGVSWTPFESQTEWNFNWGRFAIKVSEARRSINVAKTESLRNWRSGGGIV